MNKTSEQIDGLLRKAVNAMNDIDPYHRCALCDFLDCCDRYYYLSCPQFSWQGITPTNARRIKNQTKEYGVECRLHIVVRVEAETEEDAIFKAANLMEWPGELRDEKYKILAEPKRPKIRK